MTTTMTDLSDVHAVREELALLVDTLLPGTDRLPAGRAVGTHAELLDQVLAADPALVPPLVAAGRLVRDGPPPDLAELETWDPETREPAVFALTAAYYLSRTVRRALGYPGPGSRPIALAGPDENYSEDLLAPVRARGPVYVEAPT